jgi:D-3-phosphoglycerate dehydrogenase
LIAITRFDAGAAGFRTNEIDFTSTKEEIEAKIQGYQGIVIRSRFKIETISRQSATNLQFIARGCWS